MHDALLVRGVERFGNLPRDGQRFGDRQGSARQPLRQVLALHQLHDEPGDIVAVLDPVDGANVGMPSHADASNDARSGAGRFRTAW